MFGHNYNATFGQNQTSLQHKHLVLTVKHSGEGVVIWTCLAATGPEHLAVTESTMKSFVYQSSQM